MKHSTPDFCNVVRELSKRLDKPAPIHLQEMNRIIRNVLATERRGLQFLPHLHRTWKFVAYSASDYANDKEARRSVHGYFVYFCGVPITWTHKGMRGVVLSTT